MGAWGCSGGRCPTLPDQRQLRATRFDPHLSELFGSISRVRLFKLRGSPAARVWALDPYEAAHRRKRLGHLAWRPCKNRQVLRRFGRGASDRGRSCTVRVAPGARIGRDAARGAASGQACGRPESKQPGADPGGAACRAHRRRRVGLRNLCTQARRASRRERSPRLYGMLDLCGATSPPPSTPLVNLQR